jgi:hypothetical protein
MPQVTLDRPANIGLRFRKGPILQAMQPRRSLPLAFLLAAACSKATIPNADPDAAQVEIDGAIDIDASQESAIVICPQDDTGCDYIGGDGLQQAVEENPGSTAAPTQLLLRSGNYTRATGSSYTGPQSEERQAFVLITDEYIDISAESGATLDGAASAAMSGIVLTGGSLSIADAALKGFQEGTCGSTCPGGHALHAMGGTLSLRSVSITDTEASVLRAGSTAMVSLEASTVMNCPRLLTLDGSASLIVKGTTISGLAERVGNLTESATFEARGCVFSGESSGIFLADTSSAVLSNNIFSGLENPVYGADQVSITVTNNTFANSTIAAVNAYHCSGNNPAVTLVNNIFYATEENPTDNTFGYGTGGGCWGSAGGANDPKDFNTYFQNQRQDTDCGTHEYCPSANDLEDDPLFQSVGTGNYRLQDTSTSWQSGDDSLQNPDGTRAHRGAYGGPGACDLDSSLPGC